MQEMGRQVVALEQGLTRTFRHTCDSRTLVLGQNEKILTACRTDWGAGGFQMKVALDYRSSRFRNALVQWPHQRFFMLHDVCWFLPRKFDPPMPIGAE